MTELDAITGVDEESTNTEINDAIDGVVTTAASNVQGELDAYDNGAGFKGYDFENASDAVRTQIVSEFRAQLEEDVADAKTTVEETSGLLSKANTLVSASEAFETATVDLVEATNDLNAEKAKFDALNNSTTATLNNTGLADDFSDYAVTDGADNIIEVDGGKLVIATAGEGIEGIDALLAAAQAEYQALLTEDNAETRLQTAITSVLKAENPDEVYAETATQDGDVFEIDFGSDGPYTYTASTGDDAATVASELATAIGSSASVDGDNVIIEGVAVGDVTTSVTGTGTGTLTDTDISFDVTAYYDNSGTLTNGEYDADVDLTGQAITAPDTAEYFSAQTDLNSFNEAVQTFQDIAEVQSDSADLAEATADAEAAIEEFDVELNDTGTGTEANDLFVFADDALNISGFGLQGEDQLYIGGDYTEVRADGDVTDTRLGDSDTLEVFFQQEGNNAAIYVENEAFGGNAENDSDLTKITMTGVSIDDLQFENGFVSIVEAA